MDTGSLFEKFRPNSRPQSNFYGWSVIRLLTNEATEYLTSGGWIFWKECNTFRTGCWYRVGYTLELWEHVSCEHEYENGDCFDLSALMFWKRIPFWSIPEQSLAHRGPTFYRWWITADNWKKHGAR
jgi:hypothetical protein